MCAVVFLLVCRDIHRDIRAVYLCSFSDFLSTVEMDCPKGYSFKNGVTCVGEWSLLLNAAYTRWGFCLQRPAASVSPTVLEQTVAWLLVGFAV